MLRLQLYVDKKQEEQELMQYALYDEISQTPVITNSVEEATEIYGQVWGMIAMLEYLSIEYELIAYDGVTIDQDHPLYDSLFGNNK